MTAEGAVRLALKGRYFDIQRYSIHDGPGIRTTVFLKGCPLSCPWCHNPESRSPDPEIRFIEARCARCGACLEVCPNAPREGAAGGAALDPARCIRCGLCAAACPSGAREIVGKEATVREILDEAERDRPFFEESGGGITFSGGEPFLQGEFLIACLREAKGRRLHTAVDTSGHAPREIVLEAARWTDLFLYDLKTVDSVRHLRIAGVPAEPILENLRALDAAGAAVWLRVPLIPGFTDDPGNLDALGAFAAGLGRTRRVHILPYHPIGSSKYRRLGLTYPLEGLRPPTREMLDDAAERLKSYGLEVHLGG